MRAMTVRQPWATAIVRMGKDVENRSRNIAGSYRGPVAIHAGLKPTGRRGSRTVFDGVGEVEHDASGLLLRSKDIAWPYRLPVGLIIGVVELVDVHPADYTPSPDGNPATYASCSTWAQYPDWPLDPMWHLILAKPRTLSRPIPYVGRLGLWTLPDDVEEQIRGDLG